MRFFGGLLMALMSFSSSFAADTDSLDIIGFSKGGAYFAFETYGIGDGSGFPYSSIYVIDVKANSWVKGTPVEMTTEDENAVLSKTRAQARNKAASILTSFGIDQGSELLAGSPISEIVADRSVVVFDREHYLGLEGKPGEHSDTRTEISLKIFSLGGNADCLSEDGARQGFALTAKNVTSGKAIEIYRDNSIPASRQCPYKYEIDRVVGYHDDNGDLHLVTMIGFYTQGFEGPDRHIIAVPITLP